MTALNFFVKADTRADGGQVQRVGKKAHLELVGAVNIRMQLSARR